MIRTVKPGELFPDLIHLSDLLPLGSVVRMGSTRGPAYEQVAPRLWAEDSGSLIAMDAYHLSSPAWLHRTEGESVDIPLESVEAFCWRLRDTALGAAERHGIGIRPVVEMVQAFGAGTPLFTEGGVISNRVDLDRMPDGSVLYTGHPDRPKTMGVFEVKDSRLTLVMGQRDRQTGQPMTIYSLPAYTPSAPEVADDETLTQIALRAYRVGKTYQKNNSWCSVFDNCMASLGINDRMLSAIGAITYGPGDTLDRDQVARLPEGSILWWPWRSGQAFAVYVRDDSARNRSRTRRLHGYDDDGAHTHGHMIVVQTPDEPMAWRINGSLARHLPDGVTLRVNGVEQALDASAREYLVTYYDYTVTGWPL